MPKFDVVIVGAGFAGMYMLHRVRQLGLSAVVIEKGSGVGGTWFWNRYPGARCDVESLSYSYSFSNELQQEWEWSHRYATQPEILRYANHVADRFDLRRDILFNTAVKSAAFDEKNSDWEVKAEGGGLFRAHYLVMATGCLSVPKAPDLPHLGEFKGRILHTADWPDEMDFTGLNVGVVGTGSSGIQSIPLIARQAKHLTVFQRTPNYSIPAWNGPLKAEEQREMKARYNELRDKSRNSLSGDYADECVVSILDLTDEQRETEFEKRWLEGGFNYQYAFIDLMTSEEANELAAEFVRRKIRATVRDAKTAELLCPKNHAFGAKRLCVDTDYYETFNRDNVSLIDLKADPIHDFVSDGIRTVRKCIPLDVLVLATGFDAMTGALSKIDIRGRGGVALKDRWRDGPKAYLGLAAAGFPNLFMITGPGSPSVLANVLVAIEQHVEWISGLLAFARKNKVTVIEADADAQEDWARHVTEGAAKTLYMKANSWYLGANVPGKPRVFMPYADGVSTYGRICSDVAAKGYDGFHLS
ncbi:flavin-containing monooxygenase [Aestuariivirga sp.]|uniref:flavin-containing monooxygenase n=1 Tax=Aestuariivirga sp. TaxID=2650926 RepID=UPI0039E37568